jgi:hypothetical protein
MAIAPPPSASCVQRSGMGRDFLRTYDLFADALLLFERGVHDRAREPVRCDGLDHPQSPRLLRKPPSPKLREEFEMAREAGRHLPRIGGQAETGLTRLPEPTIPRVIRDPWDVFLTQCA